MHPCDSHWEAMVGAVVSHGMGHLVAETDEAIIEKLKRGDPRARDSFDPLAAATIMVNHRVLSQGGGELMLPNDDGSARCPICEALKHPHLTPEGKPATTDEVQAGYINGPMLVLQWIAFEHGLLESV